MNAVDYNVLEQDYNIPNIDDNTIQGILNHPRLYRGHVRTAMGKLYKTGDFESRSNEVLARVLP